jgi:hypothetical protein
MNNWQLQLAYTEKFGVLTGEMFQRSAHQSEHGAT